MVRHHEPGPRAPRPFPYDRVDVIVVGAGPAGIAAAVAVAEQGRRVLVLDEGLDVGGQIWRHRDRSHVPQIARRWFARLDESSAIVSCGVSVVDLRHDDGAVAVVAERAGEGHVLRASRLIIATGARERFVPFPGWTLPGVYGIGGAQALLKQGTSFAGRRVIIAGSGPLILPAAASLAAAGARLALVAEQAPPPAVRRFALGLWRRPALIAQAARYRLAFAGTPYRTGQWVTRADGDDRLRSVTITDGRRTRTIACDVLCTGYGLVPNTELARLAGCETANGAVVTDGRQQTTVPGIFAAGEPLGIAGVDAALAEGEIAGRYAAGAVSVPAAVVAQRDRARAAALALEAAFALRPDVRALAEPDTIVCRCEDVPLSALDPAWSAREAKLYTRAGMGPCQGRICGAALEHRFGWPRDTVRPPILPVSLSTVLHAPSAASASLTPSAP
jgi:D-hydroxyproline dehydrogenase subunit alpha